MGILATLHVEHKCGDSLFQFDIILKKKMGLRTSIVFFFFFFLRIKCKLNVVARNLRQWKYCVHMLLEF